MNTGEKIKQARRKVGLTQKDLAARMDTSQSYIAQYENGTRNAKPATLRRISEAIGCQLSDLIGDDMKISKEEIDLNDWFGFELTRFTEKGLMDPERIREDERLLLRYYRNLESTRKEKVVDYAADQWNLQNMERTAPEDGPGHIQNL